MKDFIQFLPKEVINQIAAGEVIQRPSSVLKELIENSIDANAKKIDIIVNDSGKTLIQLIDNGDGMSFNDARMSFMKYTTSKIRKKEDIFNINTKGFRGEALASIAFVSQLEIQTKNEISPVGFHFFIEEGKIKKEIQINMLRGTRISVKNIFYKFPARRRFLKSSRIEYKHIINEFYKIILAHRAIIYRFYHNDKILFSFQKANLRDRIQELFNQKKLFPLSIIIKEKKIKIEGFISLPNHSLKKRGDQFLFINNRCITNLFLHKKIISSYDGILKDLRTISYFIFIDVNPNLVNCNIHPSKKEVKLEKENVIGNMIQQEIKNILCYQYKVNKKDFNDSYLFTNHYNSFLEEFSYKDQRLYLKKWFHQIKNFDNDTFFMKELSNYVFQKKNIKTFQISRKYILFSWNNYFIILDQHKAHKNILLNFFFKKRNKKLISQPFLFPIEMKLSKNEFFSLKNIEYDLLEIGFHLYFCNQSVYFYSTPENVHQNILNKIFKNILTYNFIKGEKNNKEILIQSIAKYSAITYGTKLHSRKMESLIKDFFSCKERIYAENPTFFVLKKNFK